MNIIKNKEEAVFLESYMIVPQVYQFLSSKTVIPKNIVLLVYGTNDDRFLHIDFRKKV